MMKQIVVIFILAIILTQCAQPAFEEHGNIALNKQLPRVLFITTGISNEDAQMAQGVIVAVQSFNKMGATVRLEPRDILYDSRELVKYNIIVLSTFPAYHDADRQYSLTYMSDEEINNLSNYVRQGGVLISGDNVGRNYPDGTDRIIEFQQLNPQNWELSKCYGLSLSERNMTDYNIEGELTHDAKWQIDTKSYIEEDAELWTLVPDSVFSENLKVLGYWKNETDSIPAFIENKFEKGTAYLISSSSFLHPVNDGGYWSVEQIEDFYKYVINEYNQSNGFNITLNPWPNGHDYAFCVTFNSEGIKNQYKRIFKSLDKNNIKPTIFVNGHVNDTMMSFLKKTKYELESSGYAYSNFKSLKYPQSLDDILRNENKWGVDFQGFRFPYTKPGYWGLLTLDQQNYSFESSIGANNIEFIHGSVLPYNIVIANDGFFKSTDILEIAPTYHDDYYFLKVVKQDHDLNPDLLNKHVKIYTKYLENFWKHGVKPHNGLMVYLGHPQYVGYNDVTLTSLEDLVKIVKKDNTWITTINDVAIFRKNLAQLQFYVKSDDEKQHVQVVGPDAIKVNDVCLNFSVKVKSAKASIGDVQIIENADGCQLVFDAFNGQKLTIQY